MAAKQKDPHNEQATGLESIELQEARSSFEEQEELLKRVFQSIIDDNVNDLLLLVENHDVNIEDVMKTQIGRLFFEVLKSPQRPVEKLLQKRMKWNEVLEEALEHQASKACIKQVGILLSKMLGDDQYNPFKNQDTEEDVTLSIEDVTLSMFYFAVLLNRPKIGYMLMPRLRDPIAYALISSILWKKVAHLVQEAEADLSVELMGHAQTCEDIACDLLSKCVLQSTIQSHQLLGRQLEKPFQNHSLLSLAEANKFTKFMAHTSCQNKLTEIWKGHMALHTEWWKIWISVVMPVVIASIQFTTQTFGGSCRGLIDNEFRGNNDKYKQLFRVQLAGSNGAHTIGRLNAVRNFYSAPNCVFALNTIVYIIFTFLFSYFVLVELEEKFTATECVLWFWMFTMFVDEIRQLLSENEPSLRKKVVFWIKTKWNSVDLVMYFVFIVSMILRFTLSGSTFQFARNAYSITVAVFYMRLMQFFYVSRAIGPKIIMIKKMLFDLLCFLPILIVFMISTGILYQANLFPNNPLSVKVLQNIVFIPYRQMFGDILFEHLEGDDESSCSTMRLNGTFDECPQRNVMVPIFGAVYLLLTNILLVNLLIAMFSNTFKSIQDDSNEVWQIYRYSIVHEYSRRPILPPPVNIFEMLVRYFSRVQKEDTNDETNTDKIRLGQFLKRSIGALDKISKQRFDDNSNQQGGDYMLDLQRMTSVDGTQNEAYYLRLHMLIMEAQKVLRAKFDSIIKPVDLIKTLNNAKGTLDKLKKDGIISNEQERLLNPNPKSETFDITLLLCLLQNVCNLNPKDKVWAEKDNTKLQGNSDRENIQRIRNLRNKMQHKTVASLEQGEFENDWDVLETAMVDLGMSCGMTDIQNTISDLKTKSLEIVTPEMKSLRVWLDTTLTKFNDFNRRLDVIAERYPVM